MNLAASANAGASAPQGPVVDVLWEIPRDPDYLGGEGRRIDEAVARSVLGWCDFRLFSSRGLVGRRTPTACHENVPHFVWEAEAARRMESGIRPHLRDRYLEELARVLGGGASLWSFVHASPLDRAVAALRAHGVSIGYSRPEGAP